MNLAEMILESGRTALELAALTVLPLMIVMMGVTRVLEDRGILALLTRVVSPLTKIFGISGLGVLAAVQALFVSFAAPVATLALMRDRETSERRIAAGLAMVLATSQANATFSLAAAGLDVGVAMLTSLAGGLVASSTTYYVFARSRASRGDAEAGPTPSSKTQSRRSMSLLVEGGNEAVELVIRSLPVLVFTMLTVNLLRSSGGLGLLTNFISPVMQEFSLPPETVVPLTTKYVAGGTAMTPTMLDLVDADTVSPAELNRVAGLLINPLDPVGLAVLLSPGKRVASVALPACLGAACGIAARTLLHGMIF